MDFDHLPDPHLPIFGGLNSPRARRDRQHAHPIGQPVKSSVAGTTIFKQRL